MWLCVVKGMVGFGTVRAVLVLARQFLVGLGGLEVTCMLHLVTVTVLESIVTAPFRARVLPDTLAPVARSMLVSAKILPTNKVVVPRFAELPTFQKTLHGSAPLISTTDELLAVVRVLTVWNTQTALERPPASSVSAPVN